MKHHSGRDVQRSVISIILSFFISVFLTILVVFICLSLTVFSENFIINTMDDDYFASEQEELVINVQNIAASSHFPDTVFDDLFTQSMIKQDTTEYVQAIMGGITYTFDSTEVEQLLRTRFTQYAQENGLAITSETALDTLVASCAEVYKNQVNSVPFLQYFAPIRKQFDKVFAIALIALTGFLILISLFLFSIQPFRHRAFRYIIYSLFGSALMVIIPPAFLLLQGDYMLITLEPDYVKSLFVTLIRTTLVSLLAGGILTGIIGFFLMPLVTRLRENALKTGHKHHDTK